MSHDELTLAATGQKHAFIRDGALILYFDKAEVPFVARFDLDSLAQANFEVVDKKDGLFHLTLRDYSGETQTIGQFNSKNDAHQSLYLILQALLTQSGDQPVCKKRKCSYLWRVLKGMIKAALVLLVAYVLLQVYVWYNIRHASAPVAVSSVEAPAANNSAMSAIPEGEAIDADAALQSLVEKNPSAEPSTAPAATDNAPEAPTE